MARTLPHRPLAGRQPLENRQELSGAHEVPYVAGDILGAAAVPVALEEARLGARDASELLGGKPAPEVCDQPGPGRRVFLEQFDAIPDPPARATLVCRAESVQPVDRPPVQRERGAPGIQ